MLRDKRYFHTFDALRFIAFLKVFIFHLPITGFPVFNYLKDGGGIGVSFFFVLSGFLITYIIFEEKEKTDKLNLNKFFLRRILRIWPLFYLMILFAFLTPYILDILKLSYSNSGYEPNWLMSVAFLENYKIISTNRFPNVSPLSVMWSLCVEEHFYIIWGLSLFFLKIRKFPILIILSIIISIVSRIIFYKSNLMLKDIFTNIDYFAFGAIPAYLLIIKKANIENYINKIPLILKYITIIITITYVIISPHIDFIFKEIIEPSILGILFSSIIFIIIPRENVLKLSENNVLSKLGIYTYGLYLYHIIVNNFLNQIYNVLNINLDNIYSAISFGIISLLITIIISILSYHYFEKYFLNLKKYYYTSVRNNMQWQTNN